MNRLKSLSLVLVFCAAVLGQTLPTDVELLPFNQQPSAVGPQNGVRQFVPPQGPGAPSRGLPYRQFDILPHVIIIYLRPFKALIDLETTSRHYQLVWQNNSWSSNYIYSQKLDGESQHLLLETTLMHP